MLSIALELAYEDPAEETAAKRKPDRAQPQIKRCTRLNWTAKFDLTF
jgi:hypothetical protein